MKDLNEIVKEAGLSALALKFLEDHQKNKESDNREMVKIQPTIPVELSNYLKESAKLEKIPIGQKLEAIILQDMEKTAKGFSKIKREIRKQ